MYCWQTAWASSTLVHVWAAAQIARAPTVVGCKSQGVAVALLWNRRVGEEFCSRNSTFKALLSAWSELARCQPASRTNLHPKLAHDGETGKKKNRWEKGPCLRASRNLMLLHIMTTSWSHCVVKCETPTLTTLTYTWCIFFSVMVQEWFREMANLLKIWEQAC